MQQAVGAQILQFEPFSVKKDGEYSLSMWQDECGMVMIDAMVPAPIGLEIVALIHRLCQV